MPTEGPGAGATGRGPGAAERPIRIHVAGDRAKGLPRPDPLCIVVTSTFRAAAVAQAGHPACIASLDALPFRDGALGGAKIDRGLPVDDVPAAVTQCARALRGAAPIELETRVRRGGTGIWRWLAARLIGAPPPGPPEAIARRLLEAGCERIEQRLSGSLARFRGRRLEGREDEPSGPKLD